MRQTFSATKLHAACFGMALAISIGCVSAQAQDTSISPSIGDPLSGSLNDETQTGGFNTSFDSSTNNLTNPTLHSDISDPTHAALLGSELTPFDNAYVSGLVDTAPQTQVQADAQAAAGAPSGAFGGGRRSESFAAGGFPSQNMASRAAAPNSLGQASMRAAFGVGASSRAASLGAGSSVAGEALSSSGEGPDALQTQPGVGATQTTHQLNRGDRAQGYYATDPVLSGSTAGYEADLQLSGDLPLPSTQTGAFFLESSSIATPQYEYDDGQTPLQYARTGVAGQVIGGSPDYGASPSGFPDSTRGLAGLSSEASGVLSPLERVAGVSSESPLASGSEGLSFSPTLHLIPNLRTPPIDTQYFRFEAVERREQELRILHGMSISDASEAYKEDLRKYHRQIGRALPRRAPVNVSGSQSQGQGELMGIPSIR